MADPLLDQAIARRSALLKELQAVEQFIIALSGSEQASRSGDSTPEPLFSHLTAIDTRKSLTSVELERILNRSEELILKAGRPLTRTEILSLLVSEGFEVPGRDKAKVLGTNLWRSGRFENLKGRGYWPVDTPHPE